MKKSSVLGIALLLSTFSLLSAEETLFREPYEGGGFGALVVKATSFGSKTDMVTGARIGWIVNHSLILGGGYTHSHRHHRLPKKPVNIIPVGN